MKSFRKVDPWECTVERGGESFAIERHATYLIQCDKNTPIAGMSLFIYGGFELVNLVHLLLFFCFVCFRGGKGRGTP